MTPALPHTPPEAEKASGQGAGKIILFGEHAVVWGAPAIASSLARGALAQASRLSGDSLTTLTLSQGDELLATLCPEQHESDLAHATRAILTTLGVTTPLQIDLTLHVPAGAGLGSSAALAAAMGRAICALLQIEEPERRVAEAVSQSEAVFHTHASGVDQAAALSSGLFLFRKGPPLEREPLHVPPFEIAICQAAAGASTSLMVQGVSARRERAPRRYAPLAQVFTELVLEAREALLRQDRRLLGELMDFNHGLLAAIGVTSPALDHACHLARQAGALGAKLTGAGGGGCVWALGTDAAHTEAIIAQWEAHGLSAMRATLGEPPPYS